MTSVTGRTLEAIRTHPGATRRELARMVDTTTAHMADITKRLVRDGRITATVGVSVHGSGRPCYLYTISEEGEQ